MLRNPGRARTGAEEAFESGQVVGVEVVDPGGQEFAPDAIPGGSRQVGGGPEADAAAFAVGGGDERAEPVALGAGKGPTPDQPKVWAQLALMSGAKEAGAGVPRSSRRPS